jgi:hypothetical protein
MTARPVPTMPTWTAGQRVLASQLQAITTYSQFWSSRPMFRMYQTALQTLSTSAFTTITMDTLDYDTDSGRAAGTPWGYTIPVGMTGRWRFTSRIGFASNATGGRLTQVYKNGGAINQSTLIAATNTSSAAHAYVSITTLVAAGDVMTAVGWQASGGSLATDVTWPSWFEGVFESLGSP